MSLAGSSATRLSLISRIRVGDAQAWKEMVDLYSPLVAFWCRRSGVPNSDVNDLLQDVFFSVARSIDQYQPRKKGGGFRAWLWTITRNKMIDAHRQSKRMPLAAGGSTALHAAHSIPVELDESDASERIEFQHLLHRALAQVENEFEAKTWQAFWRTTIDGISSAVAAEEFGVSAATIRQYRSRVLRRLRQQLGEA